MAPPFPADSVTVHPGCVAEYRALAERAKQGRKPDSSIWGSLGIAFERAARDAQFADLIPGPRIPARFRRLYGVKNLYCADVSNFHRAFYTIQNRDVVFLDVVDHSTYDKWFPNKGK